MRYLNTLLLIFAVCTLSVQAQTDITVVDEERKQTEVLELPQGMTFASDSLLQEWNARQYLLPDSTCSNPDVNPTFEPAVYQERLNRLPAIMEMPYNSIVQQFIDHYSGRLRRTVAIMLGTGNFYIPMFEEALDYYGLPLELKYLPVIESALDPTATSRVGAVGLWQFMLTTAKQYDLEINSLVDERRDPIKSTWAAARYLRDLYRIYNDWTLVIAAYNYGPGNVNKAIHRAGGKHDYWAIYPYLPKETRGYVPAFIAANYIMNYYCEHNICPMRAKYPIVTDTVVISRNLHIDQIVDLCGVSKEAIKALNPQYRTDIIPGESKPRVLRLPQEKILTFIDLEDTIYKHRAEELLTRRATIAVEEKSVKSTTKRKTVTVRKGDTLGGIAARNGTTAKRIRQLNNLKGNMIRPGQKLRVR